jgi:cytoskeletal protein RodZ
MIKFMVMGKALKERREELGREIKEIAKITRIKASYLKAIEDEDFSKLPAQVYAKGYIREYARFLGVPSNTAVEPYEKYLREQGLPADAAIENSIEKSKIILPAEAGADETCDENKKTENGIDALVNEVAKGFEHKRISQFVNKRTALLTAVLFVFAIAAAAAYFLIPQKNDIPRVAQLSPQKPEPVQEPPPFFKPPEMPAPAQSVSIPPPASPSMEKPKENSASVKRKHNLSVSATDTVWLHLTIDGDEKKEITLNAGDTAFYEAYRSINLVVGNAAGVKLKFNGKPLENLGEKGQVVRLNLPRSAAQSNTPLNPSNPPNP